MLDKLHSTNNLSADAQKQMLRMETKCNVAFIIRQPQLQSQLFEIRNTRYVNHSLIISNYSKLSIFYIHFYHHHKLYMLFVLQVQATKSEAHTTTGRSRSSKQNQRMLRLMQENNNQVIFSANETIKTWLEVYIQKKIF